MDNCVTTGSRSDDVLYLSQGEVEALCCRLDLVGLMRELFTLHGEGHTVLPEEAYLEWPHRRQRPRRVQDADGRGGGGEVVADLGATVSTSGEWVCSLHGGLLPKV